VALLRSRFFDEFELCVWTPGFIPQLYQKEKCIILMNSGDGCRRSRLVRERENNPMTVTPFSLVSMPSRTERTDDHCSDETAQIVVTALDRC
jgi:hypothetical protein